MLFRSQNVSKEAILSKVWGFDSNAVENHVEVYVELSLIHISVDSIYTPVYKVNYTVEITRVGNMTDYDKLTLEVWTDSTISARDGYGQRKWYVVLCPGN